MVGDSAVGKTTFMTATYGLMHDGKIDGFRVRCTKDDMHEKLLGAYRDFIEKGEYPPITAHASEYEYDFFCGSEKVMTFSLRDIRGESIRDYDLTDLREALRTADVMMLFLNGYEIINGADPADQLRDLYKILNSCFTSGTRRRMILVAFTQMDRVEDADEEKVMRLLKAVSYIEEISKRNEHISYQPVPIACAPNCMMDLDFTMVSLMLFGYETEILERISVLERQKAEILKLYGQGEGFFERLKHSVLDLFGKDKKRNEAKARYSILEKSIKRLEGMAKNFDRLKKFYDDYPVGVPYDPKKTFVFEPYVSNSIFEPYTSESQ